MMTLEDIIGREDEKPLEKFVTDGGFTGIFRTIACVGDSLSSGEFSPYKEGEDVHLYFDRFDYSWGQYMARMAGVKVYNFSKGGMTAREYVQNFANNMGYWQRSLAANAYVIALGVNDLLGRGHEIGDCKDVCLEDYTKNADTFFGNYARIIQRYKEIQPEAVFFLVTMPQYGDDESEKHIPLKKAHRDVLYKLSEIFENTYVIDLYQYAPPFDKEVKKKFFYYGHMAPAGYLLFGKMIASYIDYIIRHNLESFRTVGMMGYDYDRKRV